MPINSVHIVGRLGADPELRQTSGGLAILSMRVAVNEYRKNKQTGETDEYTNWVDCSMFGERAQKVSQHVSKGSKVAIEGRLRYSTWEKDGQKRSKLEVIIEEIEFLSQGNQTSQYQASQYQSPQYQAAQYQAPQAAPQYQAPQQAPQPAQMPAQASMYDEDIPF